VEWINNNKMAGFSLLELLITVSIIGLLSAVALPSYRDYVDNVDTALAIADIEMIDQAIERYFVNDFIYPLSLEAAGVGTLQGPWGNTYRFLFFDENTQRGQMRKDKNLVPVNDDYDLYSMGKNGTTSMPFTSQQGGDDIVRTNNGRYIGIAKDY
jgi:general secretion pathway protein G